MDFKEEKYSDYLVKLVIREMVSEDAVTVQQQVKSANRPGTDYQSVQNTSLYRVTE